MSQAFEISTKKNIKPYSGSKTLLKKFKDYTVFLVDGTIIRRDIDVNFVFGGNPEAYPNYTPKGEIWIEKILPSDERFYISEHEILETRRMVKGASYKTAHKAASLIEQRDRTKYKDYDFSKGWPIDLNS